MTDLPRRLLLLLDAEQRGVTAPVGVGLNVNALRRWAQARQWQVTTLPPAPGDTSWLWCPARRSDLLRLPPEQGGTLVLADTDLLLDEEDWAAALPGQTAEQSARSHHATRGWPAALPLARLYPDGAHLHLHPQAAALLGPLLPPEDLRASAQRLATAHTVTPQVARTLDVPPDTLHDLQDGGWLWPEPHGWSFPPFLRDLLCPHPDPDLAQKAAQTLEDEGLPDAALHTLARAALWGAYLQLLTLTARASQREDALRAALRPLPDRWRREPQAAYLAGLLARAAGDLDSAEALYTRSLTGLHDHGAALAHNARGVVRAMQGDAEAALNDFQQAAQTGGLTGGEASQNRATLLIQLGRHADAEHSLHRAAAAFREAGDPEREARSLQSLGTLHFGRGQLREALEAYRRALHLRPNPQMQALTHLNIAECHLYLGEFDQAHRHMQDVQELHSRDPHPPTAGWLSRLQALTLLLNGEPAQALTVLRGVRTDDRSLQAEAALLRAQALRELRDPAAARTALEEARSLGLRAQLESATLNGESLDALIDEARQEEARLELVAALLRRARPDDLTEALNLIRTYGYLSLLNSPVAVPLAALASDQATRELFPLRIQTVGPLRFTHAGRQVQLTDFPTRKSAALLVALALSDHPQPREPLAERFWPGAKNPLASLQTAVYHLRSTFGVPMIGTERGMLSLLFPVRSDLDDLRRAVTQQDTEGLAHLLRPLTAPLSVLPDLPAELSEERAQAERLLHDALRAHAAAQPNADTRRRDALRLLVTSDPLDIDSREDLIRWHEQRGETELAEQERRLLRDALRSLGLHSGEPGGP
ncbi:tetratricopeptide repeat protein [Deinococcus taeanensis]|uniref:tetratricopeptide repeat protein n=1 Tax=Deinococcus taeanensis TaxID=2737050 RepID=UPI001CDCC310|nr:tetratricopeptide repeat protein [Deinococcus taeanensis]UBV43449.1 tetratricopeptide repeat protein [Deinococcus taeanensis]